MWTVDATYPTGRRYHYALPTRARQRATSATLRRLGATVTTNREN